MTTPSSEARKRYDDVKFEVVRDPGYTVEQAYAHLAELPLPAVEVEPLEDE